MVVSVAVGIVDCANIDDNVTLLQHILVAGPETAHIRQVNYTKLHATR